MVTITAAKTHSFWQKTRGLIGKEKVEPILINTRFGIHTFGVKFPIDVVILNNKHQVVKLATVKPNKLFFWNPIYFKVLELPEGTIKRQRITLQTKIDLT